MVRVRTLREHETQEYGRKVEGDEYDRDADDAKALASLGAVAIIEPTTAEQETAEAQAPTPAARKAGGRGKSPAA
jgi:hypothetical protein